MDFQKAIQQEKKRLNSRLQELTQQKTQIENEIKETLGEYDALQAYEAAKKGAPATKKKRGPTVRSQILTLIKAKPMSRADVIQALGYQNDKGKQQTVSNTLSTLKKQGKISLKDGTYSAT